MKRFYALVALFFIFSFIVVMPARAVAGPKLKGEMVAHKVVLGSNNEEHFVSAENVYPNDIIQYELRYTNVGDEPADDVAITGIIPEGTVYLPKSVSLPKGSKVLFSIDNGESYHPEPVEYFVEGPEGKKVKKVATPDMYTNIKWIRNVALNVGETLVVHYRVRVR